MLASLSPLTKATGAGPPGPTGTWPEAGRSAGLRGRLDRGHHQRLALLAGAEQAPVDPAGHRHPGAGPQLGPVAADQQVGLPAAGGQEQAVGLDPLDHRAADGDLAGGWGLLGRRRVAGEGRGHGRGAPAGPAVIAVGLGAGGHQQPGQQQAGQGSRELRVLHGLWTPPVAGRFPAPGQPYTGARSGSSTTNRAPPPGLSSTQTLPPRPLTSRSTRNRPRPTPPTRRVVEASSWVKGAKMRSRSIAATPSPWSATSILVSPGGWLTRTRIGVPGGACLPALSTRLPTTIRSASASPWSERDWVGRRNSTRRSGSASRQSSTTSAATSAAMTSSARSTGLRLATNALAWRSCSTMSRRRLPCRTTRWRISWPSAVAAMSGRPTSVWAMPRTTVIGVRSSWLTMARNSSLRRSTSSSRATVELRSASWASSSLERLTAASISRT